MQVYSSACNSLVPIEMHLFALGVWHALVLYSHSWKSLANSISGAAYRKGRRVREDITQQGPTMSKTRYLSIFNVVTDGKSFSVSIVLKDQCPGCSYCFICIYFNNDLLLILYIVHTVDSIWSGGGTPAQQL